MSAARDAGINDASANPAARRLDQVLKELHGRSRRTARDRRRLLRVTAIISGQAGLAAALAWQAAHELVGRPMPVFAPIAAVATIASAVGHRGRRTVELLIGIAVGIGVGDGLIWLLGSGPWQLGLIVALAIAAALLLGGGGGQLVGQAGGTAVLIAAVSPTNRGVEVPRILDALIGTVVALVVVSLLLPLNPRRLVEQIAEPLYDVVIRQLRETARALAERDADRADRALERIRGLGPDLQKLDDALAGAQEVVTVAPARWHRRQTLAQYATVAKYMDHFLGDLRGMIRRAATCVRDKEPVPDSLPAAVDHLAKAVEQMRHDSHIGRNPDDARGTALTAVHEAGQAYASGVGLSGGVVVAQVRTAASDLLRATGMDGDEADQLVHRLAEV